MTINNNLITVRQLRQALFNLDNQGMTVAELRKKLFDVDDQDEPVEIEPTMWQKLEVE